MQQITTQIQDVQSRSTAKGDIYEVTATTGKYSTFNAGLAQQARQFIGRSVALKYNEKQVSRNGQVYTNLYYEGAEPTDATLPLFNGTQPQAPQAPDERELRIHRQTAAKVAVRFLPFLAEHERTPLAVLTIADYLVAYFENGNSGAPAAVGFNAAVPSTDDIPF